MSTKVTREAQGTNKQTNLERNILKIQDLDSDYIIFTMKCLNDVNLVCNTIHNVIQSSGLHYQTNQTPWSIYITIRKKFIDPSSPFKLNSTNLDLSEKNKQLELKIAALENALVDTDEENRVTESRVKESVDNLHSKLAELEISLSSARVGLTRKETEI